MKKLMTFLSVGLLMTFVAACDNDEEATPVITDEEVADMVGSSLASNTSGVSAVTEDVANAAEDGVDNAGGRTKTCGVTESKTYTRTNPSGSTVTYNYTLDYSYLLSCSQANIPQNFEANLTYTGEFDGLRLASEHIGEANLTVGTLDNTFSTFEINGSYSRAGSFQSKVRNLSNSTSTLEITVVDIIVSKSTQQITGGTASINITGTVSGKGDFTYTASVTFLGNKQAEATINGIKYSVNLTTGEVTQTN